MTRSTRGEKKRDGKEKCKDDDEERGGEEGGERSEKRKFVNFMIYVFNKG